MPRTWKAKAAGILLPAITAATLLLVPDQADAARSWARVNAAQASAAIAPATVRRVGASCTWVRHGRYKQHPCVTVTVARDRLGQWVVRGVASTAGYRGVGSRVRQPMPVAISVRLGHRTGHTPTGYASRRYARTRALVALGPVPPASAAYWIDWPNGDRGLYRWRSNP